MNAAQKFLDAVVGEDKKLREEVEIARESLRAAREIRSIRIELGLTEKEFAEVLGLDSEEDLKRLEFGDFEEPGNLMLVEVDEKVGAWLDEHEDAKKRFYELDSELESPKTRKSKGDYPFKKKETVPYRELNH